MGYKKIQPSLALTPYVDHFWILDVQQKDLPFVYTILPYAWFELFFDLNNSGGNEAKYMGQMAIPFQIMHKKPYRAVGIRLKPNVADALFQKPANEFTNHSVNWSDLDPTSSLHAQLLAAKSEKDIIFLLESYLMRKLKDYTFDTVSNYISQHIVHQPYSGINDALFASIGLGRRRIEQRFLNATGVSMGLFVRKARFDAAIETLCDGKFNSLTQLGLELGYYDQAHFSREFKGFAGITPKKYHNTLQNMTGIERLLQ